MKRIKAFTLVEMLVVIAIIGILAGLVVNGITSANFAKRKALIDTEKQSLVMMINNYQSTLNYYPPDNGNLAGATTLANYNEYASVNPLLYELTGATNNPTSNPGTIQVFDGNYVSASIPAGTFETTYGGRSAIANAYQGDAPPKNFFAPGPQPREYTNYASSQPIRQSLKNPTGPLAGLIVPIAATTQVAGTNIPPNFWYYDASSTNRHNLASYDLWAVYISTTKGGSNILATNGNW